MICCACKEAKTKCEETCPRWAGETKPDRVYRFPWPKEKVREADLMKREEW